MPEGVDGDLQIFFKKDQMREILKDGLFELKLLGFANSSTSFKEDQRKVGAKINRPPEVVLGGRFDRNVDLWTAGCLIYKTVTHNDLFKYQPTRQLTSDEYYLQQVTKLFGKLPDTLLCRFPKEKRRQVHRLGGKHQRVAFWTRNLEKLILRSKPKLTERQTKALVNLLSHMLVPEPSLRRPAKDLASHGWLVDPSQSSTTSFPVVPESFNEQEANLNDAETVTEDSDLEEEEEEDGSFPTITDRYPCEEDFKPRSANFITASASQDR